MPGVEMELHPYMASIFRDHDSPSLIVGGTVDHIHALFALGRKIALANLVEELKTGSSKWIKTKGCQFRNFHWQRGYRAFSIGQSSVAELKSCIRNQKHHHHKITFEDEYRKILNRYEI